jgi:transposase InsO family protein
LCAVLEINPKNYYKYRNTDDPDYLDYLLIKEVFDESNGTYGYRRIAEGLEISEYKITMNEKKVRRIMKKYNLIPEHYRKSKQKHKNKRIEENVKLDLIKRHFDVDRPNKIWATDVTYLIFKDKRAYLSTILDLYDRKVVAYQISKHNDNQLVIDTLNKTIINKKDVRGVILHWFYNK